MSKTASGTARGRILALLALVAALAMGSSADTAFTASRAELGKRGTVTFEIRDVSGNPETATEARFRVCVENGPELQCVTFMIPRDQVNQMAGDAERWAAESTLPNSGAYRDGLIFSNPPPY